MAGILYIIAAFMIFIAIATFISHWRLRKHHGVPREEFIRAFVDANVPDEIPAAVYDFYKRGALFKEFGVAPDDSYELVLEEGEEEIEDDARFLMKELGLKPPSEEVRAQWSERMLASRRKSFDPPPLDSGRWMQPIQTVRDMVLWLNWIHEHQEKNAHI